jgi:Skp family chaperone for outer membrane proteins
VVPVAVQSIFHLKILLLSIFEFPQKKNENEKMQKIYQKYSKEIQKIIGARKGCWNTEKQTRLAKKVQKCKMLKFDSIFFH